MTALWTLGVLALGLGGRPISAPAQGCPPDAKAVADPSRRPVRCASEARNPERVRASQVLGLGQVGSPRVRFEWASVGGARAYLLLGAITDARTWRVTTTEHRVSSANAAEWSTDRVVFETPLNPGMYSWKLVALFSPHDFGDFAAPAVVTFEVK